MGKSSAQKTKGSKQKTNLLAPSVRKTRTSRKTRYTLAPGLRFANNNKEESVPSLCPPTLSSLGEAACEDIASELVKDIMAKSELVTKSMGRKKVSREDVSLVQHILQRNNASFL